MMFSSQQITHVLSQSNFFSFSLSLYLYLYLDLYLCLYLYLYLYLYLFLYFVSDVAVQDALKWPWEVRSSVRYTVEEEDVKYPDVIKVLRLDAILSFKTHCCYLFTPLYFQQCNASVHLIVILLPSLSFSFISPIFSFITICLSTATQ